MPDADIGYRKVGNHVLLKGRAPAGSTSLIYTLPQGSRPKYVERFTVRRESGIGYVTVHPNGEVTVDLDAGTGWVSLDDVHFMSD